MPKPIALQLYSVRDVAARDFYGVLKKIAQMGYAGVEYAGLQGKPASEVAKVIKDLGLRSSSAHVALPTKDNIAQLAADAQCLGYTRIVTGFCEKEMLTEDGVKICAERLARASETARSAGLALALHNHWWEFDRTFNGRMPFEILMNAVPQLCSEMDIYWCSQAGQDTAAVIKRWSKRIPLLHVKDGDLGPEHVHTAVGEGKMATKAILKAAGEKELEWLIVELDACKTDLLQAVSRSIKWLIANGLGTGRKA